MCGIIAYAGHRPAVPIVIEGLRRLEYRGYDSAGIAWQIQGKLQIARAAGKLQALENKLERMPAITATCAIGHTRWATHGAPVERNAHPHLSNNGKLAIVHNGIIENYKELRERLEKKGYQFDSETDTEILVNLVEEFSKSEPDLLRAFARALKEACGAYAVCLLCADEPGVIYAARMAAPLIFGKSVGENFIASDTPAFLPWTREVVFLEDGEIVRIKANTFEIFELNNLDLVKPRVHTIQWDMQAAQKDGYKHFMLKEIFEQPRVLRDAMTGRIQDGAVTLPELESLDAPSRLHIVACGTSYHSGLWARHVFEPWSGIACDVEIASEFRYRDMVCGKGEAAIFISQSGETADTLAALRKAKALGIPTIGICNVVGSSIAREADAALFTQAGPEISVASTKAMSSQMLTLALMAIYWGTRNNVLLPEKVVTLLEQLQNLPALLDDNLPEMRKLAKNLAHKYARAKNFFYIGRGFCWPLALEGALKLKELSYIHAEGYAGGELKHGPIALIDPALPSFALAPIDALFSKMKSNIEEIEARAGQVIALTNSGSGLKAANIWEIPELPAPVAGFIILPALQLFSYEVADYLGNDVDQPRNLAKSVTVE